MNPYYPCKNRVHNHIPQSSCSWGKVKSLKDQKLQTLKIVKATFWMLPSLSKRSMEGSWNPAGIGFSNGIWTKTLHSPCGHYPQHMNVSRSCLGYSQSVLNFQILHSHRNKQTTTNLRAVVHLVSAEELSLPVRNSGRLKQQKNTSQKSEATHYRDNGDGNTMSLFHS